MAGPPDPFDPDPDLFDPEPNRPPSRRRSPAQRAGRSQTSVTAILSLIAGVLSVPMICACYLSLLTSPVAIVLGHLGLYQVRRSDGRQTGGEFALVGLILGYLSLTVTVGILGTAVVFSLRQDNVRDDDFAHHDATAEQALSAVERKIVSGREEFAFGNTPQARELALRFATAMEELDEEYFTQTDAKVKLSGGHYVTWCELRPGKCVFVVHVPEYRRFASDAKELLAELAWETAQECVEGVLEEGDDLGVGLKGVLLYGSVMVGEVVPDAVGDDGLWEQGDDKSLLYPFFTSDDADSPLTPETDGHDSDARPADLEPDSAPAEAGEEAPSDSPLGGDRLPHFDLEPPNFEGPPRVAPPPSPFDGSPIDDGTHSDARDPGPSERPAAGDRPAFERPRRIANVTTADEALELLGSDDEHERARAILWLSQHDPDSDAPREEIVRRLFELMSLESEGQRFFIAVALGRWATAEHATDLDPYLADKNALVRTRMVEALADLGTDEAARLLAQRLADDQVRPLAGLHLTKMGRTAEPALLAALKHDEPKVRCDACRILGEIGSPRARQAVARLTNDPDPLVAATARAAVQRMQRR